MLLFVLGTALQLSDVSVVLAFNDGVLDSCLQLQTSKRRSCNRNPQHAPPHSAVPYGLIPSILKPGLARTLIRGFFGDIFLVSLSTDMQS